MPAHTPEEDTGNGHMQSPGLQLTLCVAKVSDLVICKLKEFHVVHGAEYPYRDQTSLNSIVQVRIC